VTGAERQYPQAAMHNQETDDTPAAPQGWPPAEYRMTGSVEQAPLTPLPETFQPTLAARTLHALRGVMDGKSHTYRTIAEGAGVEWSWLRMFGTGKIPNPGVEVIERLYTYLTGRRL
jgi:hypothetical protein